MSAIKDRKNTRRPVLPVNEASRGFLRYDANNNRVGIGRTDQDHNEEGPIE
jgi:hypothetical protein